MTVAILWGQLAAIAAIILVASQFLARSADTISLKTGLGHSFTGVVLLATATSLPELGTGISSVTVVGEPDLAAGDAFGSNLFNLLIIGLLDLAWRSGPILNAVDKTSVMIGALGMGLIGLASIAVLAHGATAVLSGWLVSPVSVLLLVCFLGAMYVIYRHGRSENGGEDAVVEPRQHSDTSLSKAVATYILAAVIIVVAAVALSKTGDGLAKEMGWEASFVGTLFLAFSTSLPELATSFAAIRIGAPTLAVSNVLGSNIFNMGIVLFLDDLAYTQGVLWRDVSQVHSLTGLIAIVMTGVVVVSLLVRRRRGPGRFWVWGAASLVALYATASILVYTMA